MKNIWAIAFAVIFTLLVIGVLFLVSRPPRGEIVALIAPPTPAPIIVHVAGAVVYPGVYELPIGSRVNDAIDAAGGFHVDGTDQGINLAAFLNDGEYIRIPTKAPTLDPEVYDINNYSAGESGNELRDPVELVRININTATQGELETLTGIGPELAKRIIAYREEIGLFLSVEDIQKVNGIGPAKFEMLKDIIIVEDVP
jgi:competence protein ComEA